MSAITKERIELFIKNPLDNGLTRGEQMEVARIALASLEADVVAWDHEWASCITCDGPQNFERIIEHEAPPEWAIKSGRARNLIPLYTAPPAPVSVPDVATAIRACIDEFPESVRDIVEECASIAESAYRAAMPQGTEPATDNTNQQFESLSRGDK